MQEKNSNSFSYRGATFKAPALSAGLHLVSTPIGNLGDMTLRGLETLAACSVIACEDTRNSGILLKHFGINRPKISYNEHNAETRGPDLLRQIGEGMPIALISDAGTPLVSDPGYRLVRDAVARNLPVIPLPGASAPLAALVGSGLESDDFRFCGFLPNREQARSRRLRDLADARSTLIFFESPNRIKATLKSICSELGPDRLVVVARELTKMHESFYRGPASQIYSELNAMDRIRGEIVIVIDGAGETTASEADVQAQLKDALKSMKTKQAAATVAQANGLSTQDMYKLALTLKDET
ncbi:MAG: 16S rRNA (cytidine(1402)-2'-O)-methyltransferase [Rhizobiaceae bacterium]